MVVSDISEQNIRVNAVCPGIIDTEMMQRFSGDTPEGRQEVIAAAVLWLCSDAASFATGHAMVVDGGQTV